VPISAGLLPTIKLMVHNSPAVSYYYYCSRAPCDTGSTNRAPVPTRQPTGLHMHTLFGSRRGLPPARSTAVPGLGFRVWGSTISGGRRRRLLRVCRLAGHRQHSGGGFGVLLLLHSAHLRLRHLDPQVVGGCLLPLPVRAPLPFLPVSPHRCGTFSPLFCSQIGFAAACSLCCGCHAVRTSAAAKLTIAAVSLVSYYNCYAVLLLLRESLCV
jgi:hypothetical protein